MLKVFVFFAEEERMQMEIIYTNIHSGMHILPLCQHIFFPVGKGWSRAPALTRDMDSAKIRGNTFHVWGFFL